MIETAFPGNIFVCKQQAIEKTRRNMPLPKRVIEPVYVTRGTIPIEFPLPSELECVTNGTLANTVRQLSSLSR